VSQYISSCFIFKLYSLQFNLIVTILGILLAVTRSTSSNIGAKGDDHVLEDFPSDNLLSIYSQRDNGAKGDSTVFEEISVADEEMIQSSRIRRGLKKLKKSVKKRLDKTKNSLKKVPKKCKISSKNPIISCRSKNS
jgi:hypothetical protein